MPTVEIDRATARRYLVLHHFLAPPRSASAGSDGVLEVIERLGSLQFDPLDVAGRNHDLVLLARVAGYRREIGDALLYEDRLLFEAYNKGLSLVPTAEMPWYREGWDRAREEHERTTFVEHAPLVEELLGRIREHGPLSPTDLAPRAAIDWYWRPTNQVRAILEALSEAGILGLARRQGNRRIYDLAERLFPAALLTRRVPRDEQLRHKLLSRYRAHGLLGAAGSAELWFGTGGSAAVRHRLRNDLVESGALLPVVVDGVRGERYVPAAELARLEAARTAIRAEGLDFVTDDRWEVGRPGGHEPAVTFLAPLDPLVWDRDLLRSLHGFDYVWEVYVPEPRRRWGYYVLPVLYGDRLVGRIEPRFDRTARALRVLGMWWEAGFDPVASDGFGAAFAEALRAHAAFGAAERVVMPRNVRHRPLAKAVSSLLGERAPVRP